MTSLLDQIRNGKIRRVLVASKDSLARDSSIILIEKIFEICEVQLIIFNEENLIFSTLEEDLVLDLQFFTKCYINKGENLKIKRSRNNSANSISNNSINSSGSNIVIIDN